MATLTIKSTSVLGSLCSRPLMVAAMAWLSVASAAATPPGFAQLNGLAAVDDKNASFGAQPSTFGRVSLRLDVDGSEQGFIRDELMLQICGDRDQCNTVSQLNATTWISEIGFFKREPQAYLFVHMTRCGQGVPDGVVVKSADGHSFMRCVGVSQAATNLWELDSIGDMGYCVQMCSNTATCNLVTYHWSTAQCFLSSLTNGTSTVYVKLG